MRPLSIPFLAVFVSSIAGAVGAAESGLSFGPNLSPQKLGVGEAFPPNHRGDLRRYRLLFPGNDLFLRPNVPDATVEDQVTDQTSQVYAQNVIPLITDENSESAIIRTEPEFHEVPVDDLPSLTEKIDPGLFVTGISAGNIAARLRLEGIDVSVESLSDLLDAATESGLEFESQTNAYESFLAIDDFAERAGDEIRAQVDDFRNPETTATEDTASTRGTALAQEIAKIRSELSAGAGQEILSSLSGGGPIDVTGGVLPPSPQTAVEEMPAFQRNVVQTLTTESASPGPLRIIKGKLIDPARDSYKEAVMAAQIVGNEYAKCSGVLLSPRHVVSAAHCLCKMQQPTVIFGTHSVFATKRVAVDPSKSVSMIDCDLLQDSEHVADAIKEGDVALYYLSEPVEDIEIRQIAHPSMIERTVMVRAVGWGSTGAVGAEPAKFMADIEIASFDCSNMPGEEARPWGCRATHEMIAAGLRDTCGGDSGGPVYVLAQSEVRLYLAGITSRSYDPSRGCGAGGIYVKLAVSPVIDWLKANGVPNEVFAEPEQ